MTKESKREELKPCPFCGGDAKELSMNRVGCKSCGIRTVSRGTRWRSIDAWNNRTTNESMAKALEEIENQFELLQLSRQGYDTVSKETIEASLYKIKSILLGESEGVSDV